jgi:hypothetical protein
MDKRKGDKRASFQQLSSLIGVGMGISISIVIGYGIGYYLDRMARYDIPENRYVPAVRIASASSVSFAAFPLRSERRTVRKSRTRILPNDVRQFVPSTEASIALPWSC